MARLQEELQKERDLTAALEAGLHISGGCVPNLSTVDEKVSLLSFNWYGIRSFMIHQMVNLRMCYRQGQSFMK